MNPRSEKLRKRFEQRLNCSDVLYVAGDGDDDNPGTELLPYRQINAALAAASPGTMVLVDDGTYERLNIYAKVGNHYNWYGIEALHDGAVVDATDGSGDGADIQVSAYVGIYGLDVVGDQESVDTNHSGIAIFRDSHHIVAWANEVHEFPGGGVNCFYTDAAGELPAGSHDMLDISFNLIHATSRFSPSNTSGISIYASRDLTQGNTWKSGYGYHLLGNVIYDVECLVPFAPGGFDDVTDGNGISLDLIFDTYGYTKPILCEGNLIFDCGARAIHAYGTVNVDGFFNTAIGNCKTDSPYIAGDPDLDSQVEDDQGVLAGTVHYHGNAICPTHTDNHRDAVSGYTENVILGGTQAVLGSNLDRRSTGTGYFVDPSFVSPALAGFLPAAVNLVTEAGLGTQALAYGSRRYAAGALEPAVPVGYLFLVQGEPPVTGPPERSGIYDQSIRSGDYDESLTGGVVA